MMTLPAVAILGAGSMGGAILGGLVSPEVDIQGGIRVTNRSTAKAEAIDYPGVSSLSLEVDPQANLRAVDGAGIVLVAVKPAMVPDLLREIGGSMEPGTVLVSVAAGVTIATMESLLAAEVSVFRAMPNTPALVRSAVTGLAAGSRGTPDQLDQLSALFGTIGEVVVVPEAQIDALSTISGSGPAYVYFLIEELTKTAIGLGFEPETAALLVNQTFIGSTSLLAATGIEPEELRRQVTSPKGTTERAIAELQAADLKSIFDRATAAALARARELAAG